MSICRTHVCGGAVLLVWLCTSAPAQAGCVVGTLAGQEGWSGGPAGSGFTNNYTQPDNFPYSSMPGDDRNRGESVVDSMAHTGNQSWHYKRGYDSPGSGTPFSPGLSARSGQPDSGAEGDRFRAVFWFRAADALGDGSRIAVVGGTPEGTDRSSNYMEIENVTGGGVSIRAIEGIEGAGWDETSMDIALGLDANAWHKIEMVGIFTDGLLDSWSYRVNDGDEVITNAYFEVARDNFGYGYEMTNRLKFQPRHANYDAAYQGFFFDDLSTEVYDSSDPSIILDAYSTSFEIPAPGGLALLALAGMRQRRRR